MYGVSQDATKIKWGGGRVFFSIIQFMKPGKEGLVKRYIWEIK